jgi:hypothetical protein
MKDCDSRTYQIGGEGIPYKDNIGQGQERKEASTSGF